VILFRKGIQFFCLRKKSFEDLNVQCNVERYIQDLRTWLLTSLKLQSVTEHRSQLLNMQRLTCIWRETDQPHFWKAIPVEYSDDAKSTPSLQ
jgi:hypothetical protein